MTSSHRASIRTDTSSHLSLDEENLALSEFESESVDTEQMRQTFRRRKLGTRIITMSEKTVGEYLHSNLTHSDQYYKVLNYLFGCFFLCYTSYTFTGLTALQWMAIFCLLLSEVVIVLNLRVYLMKFQFESVEFCYLLFATMFTFVLASSLNNFAPLTTMISFCYYTVFASTIFFDCLDQQFRKTSKWVFVLGGLSFFLHALTLQFSSKENIQEYWGYTVREYGIGVNEHDKWSNIELYIRLNFIQAFFCCKMCWHLHFYPQYSYFVTERRKNMKYDEFSIRTFRSYQEYMKQNESLPVEWNLDPQFQQNSESEIDNELKTAVQTDFVEIEVSTVKRGQYILEDEISEKRSPVSKEMLQLPKEKMAAVAAKTAEPEPKKVSEENAGMVWVVKTFNVFAIALLLLHLVAIVQPNLILDVLTDICVGAMGLICLMNMKYAKYKMLLRDIEYYYLVGSCFAAWVFWGDLNEWNAVDVLRGAINWISFGTFCHFDLLANELKHTLKYGLLFGVLTMWLLLAWVNFESEENLHEYFHIRNWNISEVDTWTNLEFYCRIGFIFSLFWLKLSYHLWFYEEYFYFNRVYVNIEDFLSISTITPLAITLETPNTVAARRSPCE